jgi:hypothetical protein
MIRISERKARNQRRVRHIFALELAHRHAPHFNIRRKCDTSTQRVAIRTVGNSEECRNLHLCQVDPRIHDITRNSIWHATAIEPFVGSLRGAGDRRRSTPPREAAKHALRKRARISPCHLTRDTSMKEIWLKQKKSCTSSPHASRCANTYHRTSAKPAKHNTIHPMTRTDLLNNFREYVIERRLLRRDTKVFNALE